MHKPILFILSVILYLMQFSVYANQENYISEDKYKEIEWANLMPADDLAVLLNPPEAILQIEDGMQNDNIDSLDALALNDPEVAKYQAALQSSATVKAFDQKKIGIPGFIVPITANEEQLITEFFIVPYFGACLHFPPPSPNQIIFARFESGFHLEVLYDAFWFEGTIVIDETFNPLAKSAYTMKVDSLHIYEE